MGAVPPPSFHNRGPSEIHPLVDSSTSEAQASRITKLDTVFARLTFRAARTCAHVYPRSFGYISTKSLFGYGWVHPSSTLYEKICMPIEIYRRFTKGVPKLRSDFPRNDNGKSGCALFGPLSRATRPRLDLHPIIRITRYCTNESTPFTAPLSNHTTMQRGHKMTSASHR